MNSLLSAFPIDSMVISSYVGPRPPDVNIHLGYRLKASTIVYLISLESSRVMVLLDTLPPILLILVVSQDEFFSIVVPFNISLPIQIISISLDNSTSSLYILFFL